jgi:hypothetical protein
MDQHKRPCSDENDEASKRPRLDSGNTTNTRTPLADVTVQRRSFQIDTGRSSSGTFSADGPVSRALLLVDDAPINQEESTVEANTQLVASSKIYALPAEIIAVVLHHLGGACGPFRLSCRHVGHSDAKTTQAFLCRDLQLVHFGPGLADFNKVAMGLVENGNKEQQPSGQWVKRIEVVDGLPPSEIDLGVTPQMVHSESLRKAIAMYKDFRAGMQSERRSGLSPFYRDVIRSMNNVDAVKYTSGSRIGDTLSPTEAKQVMMQAAREYATGGWS